ncbi:uncharacterized protein MAM_04736 [Metarhizium album ARSEF 1941]|uniref:Uncharacterized protein n=1 Tax=Metarhizium album (strain ARSEF 1941) TaxID=1081103 RepID=A0A0B2WU13_METAS|nr:uncharacterized protein MAM_04736 [Metarhizium album ARSEF 1941]KHN97139.1 hypothetical protein MAM_04736 [Metarhizium album ARSEF 1941]
MANHRAQAQFERARWRAAVLFPIWALQLLLTTSMMGLFAWRLGDTLKQSDERESAGRVPTIEFVWEATNVVMSFTAATCTLLEIFKFTSGALTPWTVLFTHIIKLTCASAILVLDVVVYAEQKEYQSLIGIGLDVALFITAITLAIYAILTYKRLSAFDDYVRPANVKGYGFNDGEDADFSYSGRLSIRNSMDKRASVGSRRLSIGSVRSVANEPVGLDNLQRTRSYYSHERDTQFDEYVARKSSLGARSDFDRRTSGDYRRDSPPTDISTDSFAVTGTAQSRVRGVSITHEASYTSDHVLVAVPEEEHEEPDDAAGRNKAGVSLLGSSRRNSGESIMQFPPVLQDVEFTEPKWQRE